MIPDTVLPRSDTYDVAVIIPTVANPDVFIPGFDRLCRHTDGRRAVLVVSVNPLRDEHADASIDGAVRLFEQHKNAGRLAGCGLLIYRHEGPAGFGGAINLGIHTLLALHDTPISEEGTVDEVLDVPAWGTGLPVGIPDKVVIFNDDLRVTEGWLNGLLAAWDAEHVEEWGETPDPEVGGRPKRSMDAYLNGGSLGMVGPVSLVVGGIQGLGGESAARMQELGPDKGAPLWKQEHDGRYIASTFLSGFCWAMTADLIEAISHYALDEDDLEALTEADDYRSAETWEWLFDERYEIAGYEDNDICARADRAGYRAVIAADTYVHHLGHQTFDVEFPEMKRGLRNRLTYYDVWRERRDGVGEKIVAVYRVRFDVPHDLAMMRTSLAAHGTLVDGVAILLTGPLARVARSHEWATADREIRALMNDASMRGDAEALQAWAEKCVIRFGKRTRSPEVRVDVWHGDFNERDERNAVLDMAVEMGADWYLSVDHDEVFESRVNRHLLERLMRHPDPLVSEWDIGFLTHWDNPRLVNQSLPWGDRGTYQGGMRGYRLVRVNRERPRRILAGGNNGLHCGNVPGSDPNCKRVSGLRFRHYGYMRAQDRARKRARYDDQDPTPNPLLVGGESYAHLTHEEQMIMSAHVETDGIGLHMLFYEGEDAEDLGRMLDHLYGVVDRIVLVWTGEWNVKDVERLYAPAASFRSSDGPSLTWLYKWTEPDVWPETGPSRDVARMAAHFGVEWVRWPLDDNLGAARNAALDALQATAPGGQYSQNEAHDPGYSIGWALFFDPDEHMDVSKIHSLRRMAEVSDTWGWMFRFTNIYEGGDGGNQSESIRMSRLDTGCVMRMNGRVHETFARASRKLQDAGFSSFIRRATFRCMNTGLAKDRASMEAKFQFYKRLTELDLDEDCDNATAWTTLGLYYENEGCGEAARRCFDRACLCSDSGYLPFQELAHHHLRIALAAYERSVELAGGIDARRGQKILEMLHAVTPEMKRQGTVGLPKEEGGRDPIPDEEAIESLPGFWITEAMQEALIKRASEDRKRQAVEDIKAALGA